MNKKIEFDYEGKHYTLEYNRNAVALIERQGFCIDELVKKPMSMLPLAFEGLFYKNHKSISREKIDEIYNKMIDKEGLMKSIAEMLNETYTSLQDEPDEKEGNIDWKIL